MAATVTVGQPGSVTAITVGYKSDEQLAALQQHLDVPANAGLEWVVVRNAATETWVGAYPAHVRLVIIDNERNMGFAAAFNQGLAAASGRVTISLNADTEPTPQVLRALVAELDRAPDVRPLCVAPVLITDGEELPGRRFYSLRTLMSARSAGGASRLRAATRRDVQWVLGACLAMRTDELREIEGLDERFFLYFEDVDLCWRIWLKGGAVRVIGTSLAHAHGRSSRRLNRTFAYHVSSAFRFFCKHPAAAIGRDPLRS